MSWLSRKIAEIRDDPARRAEYDRAAEKIRYEEERAARGWERVERGWWCNDNQHQGIVQESDNKWHLYDAKDVDQGTFPTLREVIAFADGLYDWKERP